MDVAVIGAGLAGLSCASELQAAGASVIVVEKSRGPGGRLATRRGTDWQGDLGAQYFTARDPAFVAVVERWQQAGVAAPWNGRIVRLEGDATRDVNDSQQRWVGVPRMSAITRHLSAGLDVRAGMRVTGLCREEGRWTLRMDDGQTLEGIRQVVLAVPSPQAEPLLQPHVPALAAAARSARMQGCWAVVLRSPDPGPAFDAAFVVGHQLRWIARDGSKPGRSGKSVWVAHASGAWSEARIDSDADTVAPDLIAAFEDATGVTTPPEVLSVHRWRYSQCVEPLHDGYLLDAATGIAACGDWCNGDRVEGAYLSGQRLAQNLVA